MTTPTYKPPRRHVRYAGASVEEPSAAQSTPVRAESRLQPADSNDRPTDGCLCRLDAAGPFGGQHHPRAAAPEPQTRIHGHLRVGQPAAHASCPKNSIVQRRFLPNRADHAVSQFPLGTTSWISNYPLSPYSRQAHQPNAFRPAFIAWTDREILGPMNLFVADTPHQRVEPEPAIRGSALRRLYCFHPFVAKSTDCRDRVNASRAIARRDAGFAFAHQGLSHTRHHIGTTPEGAAS